MHVTVTSYNIAQYCEQLDASTIVVNRDYQRSPKVWPPSARSYLIDTILNGYPIPKFSLYQRTDLRSRKTVYEIVDGQQRSEAIFDFFSDRLRMSGKGDYAGLRFSDLDDEAKQRFLSYALGVDIFSSATEAEIRQVFRRMNSYNVPLNRQEQRHATNQGAMKWFIVEMSELYAQPLKEMGVLSEAQLSRMNDGRLLTDICYTVSEGIKSQSENAFDGYYAAREEAFPEEHDMRRRFESIFGVLLDWPDIHRGPLMTSYNFFSLAVALTHSLEPAAPLQSAFRVDEPVRLDPSIALPNLTALAAALEDPEAAGPLLPFFVASREATNRIGPRITRHEWLCRALQPRLLHEALSTS